MANQLTFADGTRAENWLPMIDNRLHLEQDHFFKEVSDYSEDRLYMKHQNFGDLAKSATLDANSEFDIVAQDLQDEVLTCDQNAVAYSSFSPQDLALAQADPAMALSKMLNAQVAMIRDDIEDYLVATVLPTFAGAETFASIDANNVLDVFDNSVETIMSAGLGGDAKIVALMSHKFSKYINKYIRTKVFEKASEETLRYGYKGTIDEVETYASRRIPNDKVFVYAKDALTILCPNHGSNGLSYQEHQGPVSGANKGTTTEVKQTIQLFGATVFTPNKPFGVVNTITAFA